MTLPYVYLRHPQANTSVFSHPLQLMLVKMLVQTHEGLDQKTKPLTSAEYRSIKNKFLLSHATISKAELTSLKNDGSLASKLQVFKVPDTNLSVVTIWNGVKPNSDLVMVFGKKWCATVHVLNSPWSLRTNASNINFEGDMDDAFKDLLPFTLSYVGK